MQKSHPQFKVTYADGVGSGSEITIYRYYQSAIRINWLESCLYIDPVKLPNNQPPADIIFLTHSHQDHFQAEDIKKILKDETVLVAPESMQTDLDEFANQKIFVQPNAEKTIDVIVNKKKVGFSAVPAYNINKFRPEGELYHPREKLWVGYLIHLGLTSVYHLGDTDAHSEIPNTDYSTIWLIPIGGKYVMTGKEAAELATNSGADTFIPVHYDSAETGRQELSDFIEGIDSNVQSVIILDRIM